MDADICFGFLVMADILKDFGILFYVYRDAYFVCAGIYTHTRLTAKMIMIIIIHT